MNEKKLVQNYKSYISTTSKNGGDKNGTVQELKPKLLNGELVVGAAHSVVMLTPLTERDGGTFGSLFITNYKLSFVPLEDTDSEVGRRNSLLGVHDVPLTCVGGVWLTDGGPARRRRLDPRADLPPKVKGLQILCKNMKVLTFSFAISLKGSGRKVAMALVHHAFPKRHDLLFAFECKELYYPTLPSDLNMFQRPEDWKRELDRCGCPHWKITYINGTSDAFMLTAGETLVVPASVLDYNLLETARHFRSGRVPVWVWGRPGGAALLRSGELLPTEQAATAESVFLEQIRRSHPKLTPPHAMHLCGSAGHPSSACGAVLPPLPALHSSYKKLVELCTPVTLCGFWVQDSQYYSILDSSRWLRHVAACLALADEAARHLQDNVTVVLQEGEGVDYSACVSCLAQLLVCERSRTITGFQSLVQKEWVALGHPFCDRLGLPKPGSLRDLTKEPDSCQRAPVFLLFLDCTHQLTRQFPAHFEFTETYLTTVWDCATNHIFDTFLFNCPRDRELAVAKGFVQRPVWDWGEQFSEQDKSWFYNPLYTANKIANMQTKRVAGKPRSGEVDRLLVRTCVSEMELWSQCYERWLPPLDAPGSGPVQYQVHNCALLQQIQKIREQSILPVMNASADSNGETDPEPRVQPVSRFYPFTANRSDPVSKTVESMQVSLIDASQLLDSQSLLNAPD